MGLLNAEKKIGNTLKEVFMGPWKEIADGASRLQSVETRNQFHKLKENFRLTPTKVSAYNPDGNYDGPRGAFWRGAKNKLRNLAIKKDVLGMRFDNTINDVADAVRSIRSDAADSIKSIRSAITAESKNSKLDWGNTRIKEEAARSEQRAAVQKKLTAERAKAADKKIQEEMADMSMQHPTATIIEDPPKNSIPVDSYQDRQFPTLDVQMAETQEKAVRAAMQENGIGFQRMLLDAQSEAGAAEQKSNSSIQQIFLDAQSEAKARAAAAETNKASTGGNGSTPLQQQANTAANGNNSSSGSATTPPDTTGTSSGGNGNTQSTGGGQTGTKQKPDIAATQERANSVLKAKLKQLAGRGDADKAAAKRIEDQYNEFNDLIGNGNFTEAAKLLGETGEYTSDDMRKLTAKALKQANNDINSGPGFIDYVNGHRVISTTAGIAIGAGTISAINSNGGRRSNSDLYGSPY